MRRGAWIGALAVGALAVVIGGCLENERTLSVNPDGSATLTERTLYSAQVAGMMTQMSAGMGQEGQVPPGTAPKDPFQQMIDPDELAEQARQLGPGVTVKSAQVVKTPDGRQGTEVVYAVADVGKIKLPLGPSQSKTGEGESGSFTFGTPPPPESAKPSPATAASQPSEPDKPDAVTIRFTKASTAQPAKLTLLMPPPATQPATSPAASPALATRSTKQDMQAMAQFVAGMRFGTKIKVNGKIVKTNASHVLEDKTGLTLMDIRLGDLMNDQKALAKMGTLPEEMDLQKTREALKDEDLKKYIKVETNPKVEVEFK